MADREPELIINPKYDPPYPQRFYRFWPRHAIKVTLVSTSILVALIVLAQYFPVPTDTNMPPLPDEGIYIPAPEWYLFLVFQPFWYFTGEHASLLPLGTFWAPLGIGILILTVPFVFGRQRSPGGYTMSLGGKVAIALVGLLVWSAYLGGTVASGYPAKTTGCPSCHNPMMGARQALPPTNLGKYYREVRQRQIKVGRYRVGSGAAESYKDANWQLRHFYEPTMTW